MAVHKVIRSNPDLQPKDLHPRDPQLKSELLEALRHLNRGFGVALSSFDSLQRKERRHQPGIFPRDLLRLIAGNEEQEAERFGLLCGRKRTRRS